jgi:hypothetical protein
MGMLLKMISGYFLLQNYVSTSSYTEELVSETTSFILARSNNATLILDGVDIQDYIGYEKPLIFLHGPSVSCKIKNSNFKNFSYWSKILVSESADVQIDTSTFTNINDVSISLLDSNLTLKNSNFDNRDLEPIIVSYYSEIKRKFIESTNSNIQILSTNFQGGSTTGSSGGVNSFK